MKNKLARHERLENRRFSMMIGNRKAICRHVADSECRAVTIVSEANIMKIICQKPPVKDWWHVAYRKYDIVVFEHTRNSTIRFVVEFTKPPL